MNHCSTIEERIQMVSQMLANPKYGQVSQLSRRYAVSRQSLYRWADKAEQALAACLGTGGQVLKPQPDLACLVLSLLIENTSSYRKIQAALKQQHGLSVSLGKIATIIQEAGKRAQRWLESQQASTPRALALDEQYSSQRGKAYLNVIDVHSGQIWMTVPPVAVDGESWTLVLWYLQEQGIIPFCTVSDGGRPIQEGVNHLDGLGSHQRDVWHLLHQCAKVQGRLEALVEVETTRQARASASP